MNRQNSTIDALQTLLKKDQEIELAILFGSMATGQGSIKSDVDLAIKKARKNETILDYLYSRFWRLQTSKNNPKSKSAIRFSTMELN
jgi:predicted nucleotidyltransferase